ncbi:MAG: DNA methyltransferase [Chloroflexota bacterium]|nr:DNA methyltransferase [Chloroflexota bacterium]MDE2941073.1 DNA methyltransferase [Chloroflexota bacterium]MDE3267401.1 DNA methyltransferase [Chloroflexota bacterium]
MAEPNFTNRTLWTKDNLDILRGMNSECVDLIYLDPPFSKNKAYAAPIGSKAAGAWFKDTWTLSDLDMAWMGLIADEHPAIAELLHAAKLTHSKGMQSYLTAMAVRLIEMKRVLKPTGTIYLHCDPTAGHYLKAMMDAIFGEQNFVTEIAWYIGARSGNIPRYKPGKAHETILVYAVKYGKHTYNVQYTPYSESYKKNWFRHVDEDGRYYRTRTRKGKVIRQYLDVSPGVALHDTWMDISHLYTSSGWFPGKRVEMTEYPTQKPLALLDRIIRASSNEGDLVLDPFCGCATACVAAELAGRKWVGIDISPKAVELVNKRLAHGAPLGMGSLFHNRLVTAREDVPRRTDIEAPIDYRKHKHILYGQQGGQCTGCRNWFYIQNFTVDHVVPRSRGGTDHIENLQLLCAHCNSVKGDQTQEWLIARLRELGIATREAVTA